MFFRPQIILFSYLPDLKSYCRESSFLNNVSTAFTNLHKISTAQNRRNDCLAEHNIINPNSYKNYITQIIELKPRATLKKIGFSGQVHIKSRL